MHSEPTARFVWEAESSSQRGLKSEIGVEHMWKKDSGDLAPQHIADMLTNYKEAVEEFSSSAAEFLTHIPLLTRTRDAYKRASTVSTQLRGFLDKGDETLRLLMGQMEQAVNIQQDRAASDRKSTEIAKVEPTTSNGEKANAARA